MVLVSKCFELRIYNISITVDKKVFLKISQKSLENICARVSFTGAFSWNFQNFWEYAFYRTNMMAAAVDMNTLQTLRNREY